MRNPQTNPFSLFFNALLKNHIGLIATIIVLTTCILWLTGQKVPDSLEKLNFIIISFLFGQKVSEK